MKISFKLKVGRVSARLGRGEGGVAADDGGARTPLRGDLRVRQLVVRYAIEGTC